MSESVHEKMSYEEYKDVIITICTILKASTGIKDEKEWGEFLSMFCNALVGKMNGDSARCEHALVTSAAITIAEITGKADLSMLEKIRKVAKTLMVVELGINIATGTVIPSEETMRLMHRETPMDKEDVEKALNDLLESLGALPKDPGTIH